MKEFPLTYTMYFILSGADHHPQWKPLQIQKNNQNIPSPVTSLQDFKSRIQEQTPHTSSTILTSDEILSQKKLQPDLLQLQNLTNLFHSLQKTNSTHQHHKKRKKTSSKLSSKSTQKKKRKRNNSTSSSSSNSSSSSSTTNSSTS